MLPFLHKLHSWLCFSISQMEFFFSPQLHSSHISLNQTMTRLNHNKKSLGIMHYFKQITREKEQKLTTWRCCFYLSWKWRSRNACTHLDRSIAAQTLVELYGHLPFRGHSWRKQWALCFTSLSLLQDVISSWIIGRWRKVFPAWQKYPRFKTVVSRYLPGHLRGGKTRPTDYDAHIRVLSLGYTLELPGSWQIQYLDPSCRNNYWSAVSPRVTAD